MADPPRAPVPGPPPLRPFGLVLHHDGSWTHEGEPIRHRRMREHFDRHVRYLPDERKFVVFLRHFRGQIEVEEAAFFVLGFDARSGEIELSDGTRERLDPNGLHNSPRDGAWLCRIKRSAAPEGLLARFGRAAHLELLACADEQGGKIGAVFAGGFHSFPPGLV